MLQLKFWVVIKQSPNLELKTWFLAWNVKTLTHSQQHPQAPKTNKNVNSQIDLQNQCSVTGFYPKFKNPSRLVLM